MRNAGAGMRILAFGDCMEFRVGGIGDSIHYRRPHSAEIADKPLRGKFSAERLPALGVPRGVLVSAKEFRG